MKKAAARGVALVAGGRAFDSYLAEQSVERLLHAAIGADRSDALSVLRGDETNWARVLDAARTRSLFAPRRALLVRNAEALKGDGDDVVAYLDDPTPDVTLILLVVKADKRRTPWKQLFERAQVELVEPLKGKALRDYVAQELKRRQLRLEEDGVAELIERVGQDLRRLMGEIDKLEAYGFGQKPLTAEEVSQVLGRGLARPLYELSDAMVGRRPGRVLGLMEEVLEEGEAPLRVLGTLHRALRQLRIARVLRQAGASYDEKLVGLGLGGNMAFKLPDIERAAAGWSDAELARALRALDTADRRVKTGGDARVALAAAVTEACVRPEAR